MSSWLRVRSRESRSSSPCAQSSPRSSAPSSATSPNASLLGGSRRFLPLFLLVANLRRGRRGGRPIRPIFIRQLAICVPVVVPNPSHRKRQAIFVPALRHIIEIIVRAHRHLRTARVGRIGVEDVPGFILEEHADSRSLFARKRLHFVVVVHLAARLLLLGERHVIIPIELIPVR